MERKYTNRKFLDALAQRVLILTARWAPVYSK